MRLPKLLGLPDTFDPDDRRRRQLLNIILALFIAAGFASILATFSYGDPLMEILRDRDGFRILLSSISVVVLFSLLLLLNRWERAGTLAGWLFVLSLIAITYVSDIPGELVGSGLILWTLPILAGGIVLPPHAVFVAASLVSAINLYISIAVLHESSNPYAIAIYFALAALTWLGMSIANGAIRAARMEAQKVAAILDGVADGVVVLNDADQVVLANPAALSLMGSGLNELASQGRGQQELRGRVLAFEWSDVKDVGRVAIVRDVSRQVEVERARDAILGVVSHGMRTSLAAITGFAEVIALRNDMATQMAERINVNAQRLTYMVNDLLDHAQMQSGKLKMRMEPFSPASALLLVRNLLSGLAEQKSLKLKTEIDPALPNIMLGDNGRIQQILVNLMGNAVKFTDYGEVCVSFRSLETEWQMVVRDTGMGIPAERLPDIFEPFRRGSDYATRRHQGAGLGLPIVRKLVTLMEGKIEVQSTVGQGSVFTITLPLRNGSKQG
ncbi:MAG: PAS domain-containing protein [Anaerolineae bacterium]|nr:PAS domain-containing protein [Anaerolineae bacterium]